MRKKYPTIELEIVVSTLMPSDDALYFCRTPETAARYAYNIMSLRKMVPVDKDIDRKAVETFKVFKKFFDDQEHSDIPYWDEVVEYICYEFPEVNLADKI